MSVVTRGATSATTHRVIVQSIAFWSDRLPDWASLRAVCRGERQALPQPLPPSALLSAAERRRAPASVQLALHVAQRAVEDAGIDAAHTASVFASPHGDLGITHEMCATLARDATALSPTRFIHSVHNAVSGHWGMAHRCTRPSTAIAAGTHSFAAAWLEAATQVACSGEPVLLVAYETEPRGATAQLTGTVGRMAVAVVLAPQGAIERVASTRSVATCGWSVAEVDASTPRSTTTAADLAHLAALDHLAGNHLADALVWLYALARIDLDAQAVVALPLTDAIVGLDGASKLCINAN